jgi:phosphopantothenoylcysteine decarboxylase/phosphopantothenate--cysteine ligase
MGRMMEATDLAQCAADCFQRQALTGKHVLITAGPTQENIDPVRYITNHSSGKWALPWPKPQWKPAPA